MEAQDLETSDNVLVHRALSGEQAAFEALVVSPGRY